MSLLLTRMFAYFTLVCYLVVGSMAVRFYLPGTVTINFSSSYLNLLTDSHLTVSSNEELVAPVIKFAEIKIPVEKKVFKVVAKKIEVKTPEMKTLAANELPFHEPVVLTKVEMKEVLATNMVALYKDFSFEETIVAKNEDVTDKVSTTLASTEATAEPEFFDYAAQPAAVPEDKNIEAVSNETETTLVASTEVENQNVADLMEPKDSVVPQADLAEPEFFDYPDKLNSQTDKAAAVAPEADKTDVTKNSDTTSNSNIVAFDYSQAKQDITNQVVPTVTSHKPRASVAKPTPRPAPIIPDEEEEQPEGKNSIVGPQTYPVSISILALGSDLKKLEGLKGFEVRFQDDLSEMIEDYGAGEVKYEAELSQPKMTRTVTILKRGYTPVTTEIILEDGAPGSVSIPLIEEDILNDLMVPFERRGAVGALLVELDDETNVAKLDVPFGDVIKLNGDFKRTENDDFRYQLFVGVQAGNAMVSYQRGSGEVVSKILHIHESEVTYDANFYEDVVNEKVRLYEENLLAKESSPLIISGDQVKVFPNNTVSKKVNNHTYKMAFGSSNLAGRRYIELNHHSEPVFVGIRDNNNVTVPSENFMSFILSKVEGSKFGNRCLVQINLTKKAEKVDVSSESIGQSLMTSTQMLDNDGKFYDSLSGKTRKIIIIGEGQGSSDVSLDSKINVKISYQDGSVQFLNSYCSPNTYLVEQL
jgi:hypothetical protein